MRIARIGEHVAEGDAGGHHLLHDRNEGGRRVDVAACQQQAAHHFGHSCSAFFVHHGGQLQEEAVEQLVFLPGSVPAPMAPRGFGVRRVGALCERRAGEGLDIGPVDRVGAGGLFVLGCDARLYEVVGQAGEHVAGFAVGAVLLQRRREETDGALGLAIGEQMGPGTSTRRARRDAGDRPRRVRGVRRGRG